MTSLENTLWGLNILPFTTSAVIPIKISEEQLLGNVESSLVIMIDLIQIWPKDWRTISLQSSVLYCLWFKNNEKKFRNSRPYLLELLLNTRSSVRLIKYLASRQIRFQVHPNQSPSADSTQVSSELVSFTTLEAQWVANVEACFMVIHLPMHRQCSKCLMARSYASKWQNWQDKWLKSTAAFFDVIRNLC